MASLAQESPFLQENCLQDKFHGSVGEVLRGRRSCGLSLSLLTENSRAAWSVAQGQLPPLAPSDNELLLRWEFLKMLFYPATPWQVKWLWRRGHTQAWIHPCYGLVCLMARTERTSAAWRLKRSGMDTAFHASAALQSADSSTAQLAWAQSLSGKFLF